MDRAIRHIKIIPTTMIYKQEIYDITFYDKKLIMDKYELYLKNYRLMSLKLFSPHPNCDPSNKEFCLPPYIIGQRLEDVKDQLPKILEIYNIDSCYFSPWDLIQYKKREWVIDI